MQISGQTVHLAPNSYLTFLQDTRAREAFQGNG